MRQFLIGCILFCFGCQPNTSFEYSTYWWKHSTHLSQQQKDFLIKNKIKKVYLKIFDLKWDEHNNTISLPKVRDKFEQENVKVYPVIYIENEILLNFDSDTISKLITHNVGLAVENGIIENTNNLQVDCDWTIRTKENYFKLLYLLSEKIEHLSATIRLHQIKYVKATGVPPVEKGVVMIYNLDSPADTNIGNSIFSFEKALLYLKGNLEHYPLQLDVALPAFSWGVHFHHGKIKSLITDFHPSDIDRENMVQKKNGYFRAKKAHFYNTHRISIRDEIRYEHPCTHEVAKMMHYLNNYLNQDSVEVIFFSLNSDFLINNKDNYEEIISTYK